MGSLDLNSLLGVRVMVLDIIVTRAIAIEAPAVLYQILALLHTLLVIRLFRPKK